MLDDNTIAVNLKNQNEKNINSNEKSDNLLEQEINQITTFETLDIKEESNSLKVEKDNFIDNPSLKGFDIEKCTKSQNYFYNRRRFGSTYPLIFRNGEPLIVIGPHWPFFLCLTSFITFMFYLFMTTFWDRLSDTLKMFGFVIYFIQIVSYTYTALINPGIPKKEFDADGDLRDALKNIKSFRICKICNIIMNKDIDTTHCDECNVCIEGHDHHCPWTSKCVGRGNLKAFYFFVGFSFVLMGFVVYSLITAKFH